MYNLILTKGPGWTRCLTGAMVEDLSLRSVEARLAQLLLELAEDGVVRRRRWATQGEIAA